MATPDPYTDADKAKLVELWQQGLSLTEIATELNKESRGRLQLTKNAVNAKLRRMGISGKIGTAGRPNPVKRDVAGETKALIPPTKKTRVEALAASAPPAAHLPALPQTLKPAVLRQSGGRQTACAWPTSSGRPWTFCGLPVAAGRPYCADHCSRAYEGTAEYPRRG